MKTMKLPTKVTIAGQEWAISLTKTSGGFFDCRKNIIKIGTKYPQDKLLLYLHETIEALLTVRGHRYQNNGEGQTFVFTHKELDNLIYDLLPIIDEILEQK